MLEDLRRQADTSPFLEEEGPSKRAKRSRSAEVGFLGMTAGQRLVIAVMLLTMICILSTFCLLLTEKIVPPI